MKKFLTLALLALIVIQGLYLVCFQFKVEEQRHFEWVALDEANYQEITFENPREDLTLGGLLFVPRGEGPFPAAVIIHGSGTSRRDNGWYLTLTKYLQDHGVLVLLPDKRGSEQSEGDWRTSSLESLATDTVAAVDFLQERDEVAPGLAHLLAYPAAWSIIHLRQKAFWDAIGEFDSTPYWKSLDVPALALYGEDDGNTPSQRSAARLRALGKPNIEVRIYEGSGHALEAPWGKGDSIFRKDALKDIRDFIASVRKNHATMPE